MLVSKTDESYRTQQPRRPDKKKDIAVSDESKESQTKAYHRATPKLNDDIVR